jgi:hypothetical protein
MVRVRSICTLHIYVWRAILDIHHYLIEDMDIKGQIRIMLHNKICISRISMEERGIKQDVYYKECSGNRFRTVVTY